ncbi:hypothetical protein LCGC14_1160780 [marine sediment metagenome]|uniref:Sulfatase-modifying factor enzyme domain-containing protein n=1 Tax=marine sediment metagenome TaxID=412755 RepID=A0A0F9MFN9_9ZZZZ
MNTLDILCSKREVFVLTEKPNVDQNSSDRFWSVSLGGLHQDHLRDSVASLRKKRLPRADSKAKKGALKSVPLLDSLARSLGARSYDHWLSVEQPKIIDLLSDHRLAHPANLISWSCTPGLSGALTAQQVADRLFNSDLPLPKRIFTGVGSPLFAASGYGRLDIGDLAGRILCTDEERYEFCVQRSDEVLLRAKHMKKDSGLASLDLTGRMLMLNATSEFVGCMYTMLGSNLMDPPIGEPVMRSYDMSEEQRLFEAKLFEMFRAEIEGSNDGWTDVIPVPGNDNLIFLRGANGAFDWVVRDQRDREFSSNPHYPFFTKSELPTAMDESSLQSHLYFSTGKWHERLEHDAEDRHYKAGGTIADWPGYAKLIQRELTASEGYCTPRSQSAPASDHFVAHRLDDCCLMVSDLITIEEFSAFEDSSDWSSIREARACKAGYVIDGLSGMNTDPDSLPVSVTWLDAVAYCKDYEKRTGLPVRLMTVEEWQQVAPPSPEDFSKVELTRSLRVKPGELPDDPIYAQMRWGIVGGDGRLGGNSTHCHHPDGILRYAPDLRWTVSKEGAKFLCASGVGEWLADFQNGFATFACAATHQSLVGGPIERNMHPVCSGLMNPDTP